MQEVIGHQNAVGYAMNRIQQFREQAERDNRVPKPEKKQSRIRFSFRRERSEKPTPETGAA